MRRYLIPGLFVACTFSFTAWTQDGGLVSLPPTVSVEGDEALAGDVLNLRTGQVLRGVQILRETPRAYMIQVVEGVEPLVIPRRQVASVEKNDIEPWSKRYRPVGEEEADVRIDGQPVPQELVQGLQASLTETPQTFKQADYMMVLRELASSVGLPLEFADSITKLPPARRSWSVTVEPGMNFQQLRELLLESFPALEVMPVDKKIQVSSTAAPAGPSSGPQRLRAPNRNRVPGGR